ncbi:transcription factor E2F7 [Denticeps clupeoides]|uniref:transcription factor E2F7 n=1 Tax=Denticeps clupeoides TaxID=299321 RepID=UPI0010A4938B|nr:transcription factor E2F7 [Denticeps clupeoides]
MDEENICLDRRKITPHKGEHVTMNGRKVPTPDLTHMTPIKHPERTLPDPWTPTANLKMLISVASPDIRDREMKKTLFRPIENEDKVAEEEEEEDTEMDDSCQCDASDDIGDEFEKRPSRKQKSLGLLCQKFLALYPDYPTGSEAVSISLDEVAANLGVERRRIYDIVNVLESLMLVSRLAKNQYLWHGRPRLNETLQKLQQQGRQQRYHLQMEQAATSSAQMEGEATLMTEEADGIYVAASRRKDKSLRIMSQKFVMLFLVSKTQMVTLDTAAKILIEESHDMANHSKYKTKVRRLYDIANVLTSLSLIKKVYVKEDRGRKPVFQWIGPTEFHAGADAAVVDGGSPQAQANGQLTAPMKGKMVRHASFNVVPTSALHFPGEGHSSEPLDYSRKSASDGAACRLQFDEGGGYQPSVALPIATDGAYMASQAPAFTKHHLAYLPSLSQPSVLMLYGAPPAAQESSRPETEEKRKSEEEGPSQTAKRPKRDAKTEPEFIQPACSHDSPPREDGERQSPPRIPAASHYLYVPNSPGLNFLLSAGHAPGGVALSPGGMSALAMPCVLLPSSQIPPYPLTDSRAGVNFNVVTPAHFVLGAGAFAVAGPSDFGRGSALSSPEQAKPYGSPAPRSPAGPRQPASLLPSEPHTPHTPKEVAAPGSKALFQTPATLGAATGTARRKRGSAQRRLDIGHLMAS